MQSYQNNAQVILAIDAGGTFLKSALFEADRLLVPLAEVPACSNGTFEEIKNAFVSVYQNAAEHTDKEISGIAVSVPGPFDYVNGIFRMEHKFQAVKNCCMRDFFPALPITFIHDANAFLGGANTEETGRAGGITLGTGLGAAVMIDGKFINNGKDTPLYSLWNKPFRNGIGEDYVSTAALLKACPDAKSVKEMAERSDTDKIWQDFGDALSELLQDFQAELQLEKIYIGGGISKAKNRFMTEKLAALPLEFVYAENLNLYGAVKNFREKTCNIMNEKKRYAIENFADIEAVPCPCGMSKRAFVKASNGAATFHQVEIKKDAALHYHKEHIELYLILEGSGFMELDGEKIPVKPGNTVFIDKYCRHRALGEMKIANVSIPSFAQEDEWFD